MSAATASRRGIAPRHEIDNTTLTTEDDERGFFLGSAGAEIYAVCSVGSFLPVTLEQLAREHGVLRSDHSTSCITRSVQHGAGSALSSLVRRAAAGENDQCVIQLFGRDIATSSFALYSFSLAVLCQALVLISFSPVADYGTYRKRLLIAFALAGALSSMLFIIVTPSIYLVAPLLVVVGVVSLGLRDGAPEEVLYVTEGGPSAESRLSSKISSKGVGIGYIAAVTTQLISIGLLVGLNKLHLSSSTIAMRAVLLMVGILWASFTIPMTRLLRSRPGPPLPEMPQTNGRSRQIFAYISFAWRSVWGTVKIAARLPQARAFLLAWFLLSDSIATVSGTAILYARTELHMGTVAVAILSVTATTSGIAGAFLWPILSRRFALSTKGTIIACIVGMEIIPIYGLLGFLPLIQSWGVGGLQRAWEIYPLGVVHGFVMGGLSAYCRSFFGLLIPPGSEAAFYALYAITDKGSSAVGPTVVGIIIDSTGSIRSAFAFLAVLILLPLPILVWFVDADRGKVDAVDMAKRIGRSGGKRTPLEGLPNQSVSDDADELSRTIGASLIRTILPESLEPV